MMSQCACSSRLFPRALVADGTEGNAVTATVLVMETDADMETCVMLLTNVIEVIRDMATEYNDSTTKTGRRGHRITERDHGADPTHLNTISISCRTQ